MTYRFKELKLECDFKAEREGIVKKVINAVKYGNSTRPYLRELAWLLKLQQRCLDRVSLGNKKE